MHGHLKVKSILTLTSRLPALSPQSNTSSFCDLLFKNKMEPEKPVKFSKESYSMKRENNHFTEKDTIKNYKLCSKTGATFS